MSSLASERSRAALLESEKLRYKIDLPPEEEYTKSYKFTGQSLVKTESERPCAMIKIK